MTHDVTATQEAKVTLTVEQLEGIIHKVVREELMEFLTQEQGIFNLDKESPLYEDMEIFLNEKNPVS